MKASISKSSLSANREPHAKKAGSRNGLAEKKRSAESSGGEVASLNVHPFNRHARTLLPKWALRPDDSRLDLLTLVAPARFATKAQAAMLKKMRTEWAPAAVLDYFSRVEGFADAFLSRFTPLEAVQVILAAVDIVAEPQRYLPAFELV